MVLRIAVVNLSSSPWGLDKKYPHFTDIVHTGVGLGVGVDSAGVSQDVDLTEESSTRETQVQSDRATPEDRATCKKCQL